ncbi:cytochrome c biogenesis protein ResB [Rhodococcus ruber]|uniref:cytochrome c biogenesis protein ResB n=2 Tax=Rhodococcus TaxID=1827 RepID=UPI00265B34F8|nr:cytochrome c biogenesis protein ResB [Rhodococcus ruber]WKK11119.1 cytochrome c biogenesis protein ResB [Rhodococcus ruber]WKK11169.1 cytochrome c biogenesis protein ResB [Rhodococcus ruber]
MTVTDRAPASKPSPPPEPSPLRRAVATARNLWRQLTSMRTALVLLFLLALAAVPGALLPQRSLNAGKVDEYIAARPVLGPVLDRLEAFDVFASFWFTAVYALLMVSLIGCLIPRLREHLRAVRSAPVPAPRNLSRLPHHHQGLLDAPVEESLDRVHDLLRGWRRTTRTEPGAVQAVSAEKGYLREAGNLVFHFSLVGLLVAVATGRLFGYEGSVIVIADGGPGLCNTSPAVYDSFRAGAATDGTGLDPFCLKVEDFSADYLDNGQAEMFTSTLSYQTGTDIGTDRWQRYQVRVNEPLRLGDERVYLTGHGYAPRFTVTFPDGQQRTETLQFAPEDATTFLSSGALRFDPPGGTYPDPDERRRNQIAIEGLFAPTAAFNGTLLTSVFPDMRDPAVAVDIYKGDTGLDTGIPQSIFSLNAEMINQGRLVKQARVNLRPGEHTTLTDGTTVRFDGAEEFAYLQVSHDPAQNWVLVFAITMMGGLVASLVIKRRRIWVRLRPAGRGTAVELGGLARTDHAGWGPEFTDICRRLAPGTGASPAAKKDR